MSFPPPPPPPPDEHASFDAASSGADDEMSSIDETLLNQEFGVKERLVRQEDLDGEAVRLYYLRLRPHVYQAPGGDDVMQQALAELSSCSEVLSSIDPHRVRLSQSRYEQTRKRKEYRKKYNMRPDVIAKRLRDKNDPVKQQKKKEYNARAETRERKKEIQRVKNLMYQQVQKFAPQISSATGADLDKIMKLVGKETVKIVAKGGESARRNALKLTAIAETARQIGEVVNNAS